MARPPLVTRPGDAPLTGGLSEFTECLKLSLHLDNAPKHVYLQTAQGAPDGGSVRPCRPSDGRHN